MLVTLTQHAGLVMLAVHTIQTSTHKAQARRAAHEEKQKWQKMDRHDVMTHLWARS